MKQSTKSLMVGAASGAVVFGAIFGIWLKRNMGGISDRSEAFAATVAEESAKTYLATRFGLTTERLGQIRNISRTISHGGS